MADAQEQGGMGYDSLEGHDRLVRRETAKRIIAMAIEEDTGDFDSWLDAVSREFGLEGK